MTSDKYKRKFSTIPNANLGGYSPLIQIRVYFIFLLAISWVSFTLLGCNGSSNGGSNDSGGDAPSPPEVTNLTVEKVKNKRVTLSWRNPLYDDLDKIEITYPEITTPIEVGKDLQIVDIIVPLNSVKYSFLVRTVSKAGGKSNGVCISATATGKLIYRGSSLHQMGACYCGPCDYGSYYEYDSDDDLIKITTYKLNAEGECLVYDPPLLSTYEIYEYDELGNNISMLYYDKNDNLIYYWRHEYDGKRRIMSTEFNADGSLHIRYEYDDFGNSVKESGYQQNELTWQLIYENEYDDCKNMIKRHQLSGYTHLFQYDDHRDLISVKHYNSEDVLESEHEYLYNPNRTLSEILYHKTTQFIYWYDQDGNKMHEEYYRLPDEMDSHTYRYE